MTRVLLTGVGGSIGCHTLAHLLKNTDWSVIGLDSFRHKGRRDRAQYVLNRHPEFRGRVRIEQHDLYWPVTPRSDFNRFDYVVAMASLSDVKDSIDKPIPFVQNNVNIALHTLEFCRQFHPKSVIWISSDEVYGPTDGVTIHKEWDAIVPSNSYSASKAAQEALCVAYWRSYGVPVILVNMMNNFGEMQSPSKFPAIVQRKVRAGECVDIHANGGVIGSRYYLHSRNASDALLFLLRNATVAPHRDGSADRPPRYNLVGERRINNLELAQIIAGMVGKPLEYRVVPAATSRPGHDVHYGLDGSKLAALGWQPPVSFEESLRRTVEWYERNPEWLV